MEDNQVKLERIRRERDERIAQEQKRLLALTPEDYLSQVWTALLETERSTRHRAKNFATAPAYPTYDEQQYNLTIAAAAANEAMRIGWR